MELERKLLEMAYTTDSVITASSFAFYARCSVAEAEALLDQMAASNKLRLEADPEGAIIYVVPNRQQLASAATPRPPSATPPPIPASGQGGPLMRPVMNVQAQAVALNKLASVAVPKVPSAPAGQHEVGPWDQLRPQ